MIYKKLGLILLVMAAVGLGLGAAGGILLYQSWRSPMTSLEPREFTIARGDSPELIANRLVQEGLLTNSWSFRILVRLYGYAPHIKAGRYGIQPGDSLRDFTQDIVSGNSIPDDITLRFTEGMRVDQMGQILEQAGFSSGQEFNALAVMDETWEDLWVLQGLEPGQSLNGYLFPDTYRIRPGTQPRSIIRTMVENLQVKLQSLGITNRDYRSPQGLSIHEILTFASIVQQESPLEDMELIAGVFENRLERGMRFESDATVNFILGTSKLIPTATDIRVQHPYNTYLNRGLPPGPIGNPGIEAIRATLNPEQHDYLFFLHTPEGVTVPSRTFQEHLAARRIHWE